MTQDTRKDKRAKIVSLNVRYKSATVDEFIENHSHDVSRGGIFVKTPTPFPPGTLLKFEIRLAGDKSVIAGVGRVVWKRESQQATAEKPAGMGVKFIKIDDASRAVIDRLVAEKADAGSAYTAEAGAEGASPQASPADATAAPRVEPKSAGAIATKPAVGTAGALGQKAEPPRTGLGPPPAGKKTATVMGVAPSAQHPASGVTKATRPSTEPAHSTSVPTPAMGIATLSSLAGSAAKEAPTTTSSIPPAEGQSGPPRPRGARKATMIGMGSPAAEVEARIAREKAESGAPAPGASSQSRVTVEPPPVADKATGEAMFPTASEAPAAPVNEPTVMKQAAELLEEALREAGGSLDEIGQNPLFAEGQPATGIGAAGIGASNTATLIDGAKAAKAPSATSEKVPAATTGEASSEITQAARTPSPAPAKVVAKTQPAEVASTPASQAARRLSDDLETPKKKGGGGLALALLAVVLVAGGGVYAWKAGLLAGGGESTQLPTPEPSATMSSAPSATATEETDSGESLDSGVVGASDAASIDAQAPGDAQAAGGLGVVPSEQASDAAATSTDETPQVAKPTPHKPHKRPAAPKPTATGESTASPDEAPAPSETAPQEQTPAETKPKEPTPAETAPKPADTTPKAPAEAPAPPSVYAPTE